MNGNKKNEEATKEDCKCLVKSKKICPPIRNVTHPLRYYEFSQEELKALEECDKESFYHRCLPFSTLFAATTYAGIRTGYLSRNPHFGVIPKVALAIVLGHVCGRLSYIPQCAEKLRNLPSNSYLGNVMRQHYMENIQQQPVKT